MVIVVLAIVGILATVALWISLTNFQMKVTDQNVTDSFYSAEGVLNQICAGLQGDVSEAIDEAYNTVMQRYASLSVEEKTATFASTYMTKLRNELRYSGDNTKINGVTYESDMMCDLEKLSGYISKDVQQLAKVEIYPAGDTSAAGFVLSTTSGGLVIKDLVVEYTDEEGYLSIIQTDIVLSIPDMNLVNSQSVPNVFGYSIIGNGGVTINGNGTKIDGSVYAGSANALKESDSEYVSLVVKTGATVDFSGADYVIADGDITVSGSVISNDTFVTNPFGQLWARNLEVSGAVAGLLGTTYLADDLTLSGENAKVYFSAETEDGQTFGNYFGYGTSTTDASGSSAIVINGKGAQLDLSGVGTMAIGGYAYIGTSKIESGSSGTSGITNSSNIQLGESIAVKGDQIAYLVPAECIATSDGTSLLSQNPISVKDYESFLTLMKASQTDTEKKISYQLVDENVTIKKSKKTLSEYRKTADEVLYTMIVVPSKNGYYEDGLVYFYLNLDAEKATQYFLDYFNADSTKLAGYTGFYTQGILAIGEETQIYTAGTYTEYTAGDSDSLSYAIGTDEVNGGLGNCSLVYEALTTKLITSYSALADDEKKNTVFSNIVERDALEEFLSYCTGNTYTASVENANGGESRLVLIDNVNGETYVHEDGNSKNSYIIIATGDVQVDSNFVGTIIAGGTVMVGKTANLTLVPAETEYIKKLLAAECTNDKDVTMQAYEFFKDGNIYMINGFIGSSDTTAGDMYLADSSLINLGDLITYQNWKKK
jgi:type II secretory pathway pseudopilin PulG